MPIHLAFTRTHTVAWALTRATLAVAGCLPPCRKRKLEELVTKHLGRERDVSDEDIKSSVLYGGWHRMYCLYCVYHLYCMYRLAASARRPRAGPAERAPCRGSGGKGSGRSMLRLHTHTHTGPGWAAAVMLWLAVLPAGWGNLMRAAEEDGKGGKGAELALSEAELAQLLDRQHVFADDLASGADAGGRLVVCIAHQISNLGAVLFGVVCGSSCVCLLACPSHAGLPSPRPALAARPTCLTSPSPPLPPSHPAATLLGEVRAGGAAALKFEREASGEVGEEGGGAGAAGANPEMEAAMVRLIQQRARKYEQDKAVSGAACVPSFFLACLLAFYFAGPLFLPLRFCLSLGGQRPRCVGSGVRFAPQSLTTRPCCCRCRLTRPKRSWGGGAAPAAAPTIASRRTAGWGACWGKSRQVGARLAEARASTGWRDMHAGSFPPGMHASMETLVTPAGTEEGQGGRPRQGAQPAAAAAGPWSAGALKPGGAELAGGRPDCLSAANPTAACLTA